MSPVEAIQILGLRVGKTYTSGQLEDALTRAQGAALSIMRYSGGDIQRQEQAGKRLSLIGEASKVLKGEVRNGKLVVRRQPAIPASAGAVSSRRPRIRQAARRAAPAPVTGGTAANGPSAKAILQQGVSALWNLAVVVWWLVTFPIRALIRKRLVRSAVALLLVAILLWLSWTFLTGGIRALALNVQAVCEALNRLLRRQFE